MTVTKNTGNKACEASKTIAVITSGRATIVGMETTDWTSNQNTITVLATGSGDYEYAIDGTNYQSSNQFHSLESGEYTVYVRDKNGCGISKDDVYLLMYPKFLTPNGDGYNDQWGTDFSTNEPALKVTVFDRYGKFIKLLSAIDPVWDGTYNGGALPATDYWFMITRENGQEHRGHFSLKR